TRTARSRRRPRRPKSTTLLLELLVYPLAVRADRRSRLRRLRHRKHLAAERDDVGAHDGALSDLVLLHVVEDLRGGAVGPAVTAFVGIGALDRLGSHVTILPLRIPARTADDECGTVEL